MSNEPVLTDFTLLVTLHEKSDQFPSGKFKATVSAQTLEDACRAIIARQMEINEPVRRIRQAKKRTNQ